MWWLRPGQGSYILTLGSSQATQSGTGLCEARNSQSEGAASWTCLSHPWVTATPTQVTMLNPTLGIIFVFT